MPKSKKQPAPKKASAGKVTAPKPRSALCSGRSKTSTKANKTATNTERIPSVRDTPPRHSAKVVAKKPRAVEEKPGHGLALVRRCVKTLRNKKAAQIEVIRVAETSSVTDFYIIATGTSDPHLRALRVELEKTIDEVVPQGGVRIQNEPGSGWCVVDAFDVVVHLFSAEKRSFYNLEELYSTGKKIKL